MNDKIEVTGPYGNILYEGNGVFRKRKNERETQLDFDKWDLNTYKRVFAICGGTGITPIYQVIQSAYLNKDKATEFRLIYGNKTEVNS